jgi:hypothetical protein
MPKHVAGYTIKYCVYGSVCLICPERWQQSDYDKPSIYSLQGERPIALCKVRNCRSFLTYPMALMSLLRLQQYANVSIKQIMKPGIKTCSFEKRSSFLSHHQHGIEYSTPSPLPCRLLSVVKDLGEAICHSVVWYNCTDLSEELPSSMIGQTRVR